MLRLPSGLKCLRKAKKAVTIFGVLFIIFCFQPKQAEAGNFWETIGISTAVGTVLGLSTIPFYSEPSNHLVNVGIGAGVGLVFGLGLLAYQWISPSDSASAAGTIPNEDFRDVPQQDDLALYASRPLLSDEPGSTSIWNIKKVSSPELKLWMPLVSLTW